MVWEGQKQCHDTTLRSQNAEQLRENGWLRCTVLYMSTVYCILSLILDLILNMILNWGPRKAGTQVRWRRPWLATRCISGYCTLADAVTRRGLLGGAGTAGAAIAGALGALVVVCCIQEPLPLPLTVMLQLVVELHDDLALLLLLVQTTVAARPCQKADA